MQVGILGPLEVRDAAGAAIEVTGARLRALLVRLALDAGRPVPAVALVSAVWGGRPPADEANALQTLVSRLRRSLGNAALVGQSPAGYRLAVDDDDVDARRFENLVRDGAAALRDGHVDDAATTLRDALRLWRGPACADGGEGLAPDATRLDELRVTASLDLSAALIEIGQSESALPGLEMLARERPLDERVAHVLVTTLGRAGRQADALRAYEAVRERLAEELGVDPSADLQRAHLAVLRGELTAPKRQAAPRTNLTAALTSFVGRDKEIARVRDALRDNRLVTLVGPGGAGKTRLAGEAAAGIDTHDGVWLAELAAVTDGADIAQVVLGALGLREKNLLDRRSGRGPVDAEERLLDVLTDRQVVIVLDNCEHVLDGAARLAEFLLGRCPGLRVLTTSREPLGIFGEVVLAVQPLGQPTQGASASDALHYPAVRLFADRAAAARPDLVIDDDNIDTVVDIVRRLDGLPLAIELAAARLRTLPLAEVAGRLSDRFRLLTGGSRNALPRHRTLRAVVEWSWELLAADERALVERLAVFPAGVTVESASAVATDADLHTDDVPDLLAALVDKSLLQRVGDGGRLRMLETIREYGIERLGERGELEAVRTQHAQHFADLLARAEPHLVSREQLPWFDLLTAERENLVAALRFCCDVGEADRAVAIGVGLSAFAMMLGEQSDIGAWIADALAVPDPTENTLWWAARALHALNAAAGNSNVIAPGDGRDELREIAKHLGPEVAELHPLLGVMRPAVAFLAGDEDLSNEMIEQTMGSENAWLRAAGRMFRAMMHENSGDIDGMRADVDVAIVAFRELGERWGLANTLRSRGLIHALDGKLAEAEVAYSEAFELTRQLNSHEDEAFLLVRIADLALRQGDVDRARQIMADAAATAEASGSVMETVFALSMVAEVERQAGNLERSRELHRRAWQRVEALPATHSAMQHARAIVYVQAARMCFDEGDVEEAGRLARAAYDAAIATRDLPITAAIGVVIADLVARTGGYEVAARILGSCARLRGSDDATAVDIIRQIAVLREHLGADFDDLYADGKGLDRDAALKQVDPAEALSR